jgi:hypothetical protein
MNIILQKKELRAEVSLVLKLKRDDEKVCQQHAFDAALTSLSI